MKKVSVAVQIVYRYTTEISDDFNPIDNQTELVDYCDEKDPAFSDLAKTLSKSRCNWDARIFSIVDDETGEYLYEDY